METNVDIGVKYADKQQRHFDDEKMKAGQCVIGLQVIGSFPGTPLMFLDEYHTLFLEEAWPQCYLIWFVTGHEGKAHYEWLIRLMLLSKATGITSG